MSQAQHRPCHRPGWPCRALYRSAPARVAACRVATHAPCRKLVSQYNPTTTPRAVSRPTSPPPRHNTICITTQPGQAMRARAGRPYHGPLMVVSWHRLGRVVAEAWPCRGPWLLTPTLPSLTMLRYNQLYRDPAPNMGSSPSNCQKLFFFPFSSKPNIFLKIYFILFSNFTHCKTLKKIFSTSFSIFHLILDHFVQNFSNNLFSH